MDAIAARLASSGEVWESLPLELILSVAAVILAGSLTLAGVMP